MRAPEAQAKFLLYLVGKPHFDAFRDQNGGHGGPHLQKVGGQSKKMGAIGPLALAYFHRWQYVRSMTSPIFISADKVYSRSPSVFERADVGRVLVYLSPTTTEASPCQHLHACGIHVCVQ